MRAAGILAAVAAGVLALSFDSVASLFGSQLVFFLMLPIAAIAVLQIPYVWAIHLLFLYVSVEGMVKIFTNYNPVFHVGSDILIWMLNARLILAWLFGKIEIPADRPPLIGLFCLHFAWVLIEMANPYALGIIPSLAGFKVYVNMTLLFGYGYYLATDVRTIHRFFGTWVLILAVQTITSLYQAWVGPISVTALHPGYIQQLQKFGSYAFRPFGTTSLAGGPAVFIALALPLALHLALTTRRWGLRLALFSLLPLGGAALAFCQVRSALLKGIVSLSLYVILSLLRSSSEIRRRVWLGAPVAILLAAFAVPYLTSTWVSEREENAMAVDRSFSLFDSSSFANARLGAGDRIITFATKVPLGAGMSRAGAAAGKFQDLIIQDPFFPEGFFADNLWAAIIAELGVPGALILTLIVISILVLGIRGVFRSEDPEMRTIQAVIWSALVAMSLGFWGAEGLLYNPEAAFFWFFAGVMLRAGKLSRSEVA